MITLRTIGLFSICLFSIHIAGCPGEAVLTDDDDFSEGDDDDSGTPADDDDATPGDDDDATPGDDDDDATPGDDDDDDTGGSTDPDDNTCDEGATSSTSITFTFQNALLQPVSGADWALYDLDAFTGDVDATVIQSGTSPASGEVPVTLDCAYGWMLLETTHPDFLNQHSFFRVVAAPNWPIVLVEEAFAASTVGLLIAGPDEGLLGVYKATAFASPDLQGGDTFTLDNGPNLVPGGASNDLGMWVYDGALGIETAGIWHVDADVPGSDAVALLHYEDSSEGHGTAVNLPIWSWDSGNGNHELTVVYVID